MMRNYDIKFVNKDNTSVNFYRKIKSQTIEPAKVGSKTLKRSLKCCQNEWLSMKKCAEKSGLTC